MRLRIGESARRRGGESGSLLGDTPRRVTGDLLLGGGERGFRRGEAIFKHYMKYQQLAGILPLVLKEKPSGTGHTFSLLFESIFLGITSNLSLRCISLGWCCNRLLGWQKLLPWW